jgi:hypothetical protein
VCVCVCVLEPTQPLRLLRNRTPNRIEPVRDALERGLTPVCVGGATSTAAAAGGGGDGRMTHEGGWVGGWVGGWGWGMSQPNNGRPLSLSLSTLPFHRKTDDQSIASSHRECVCVCVRERERERAAGGVCVGVSDRQDKRQTRAREREEKERGGGQRGSPCVLIWRNL